MTQEPKFSSMLMRALKENEDQIAFSFGGLNHITFYPTSQTGSAYLHDGKFKKVDKSYDELLAHISKGANCVLEYVELTKAMIFHLRNGVEQKGDSKFDRFGWTFHEINSDILLAVNKDQTAFQVEYSPELSMPVKFKKYMKAFTRFPLYGAFRSTTSLNELIELVRSDINTLFSDLDADKIILTIKSKLA